jgi:hypothetical protein
VALLLDRHWRQGQAQPGADGGEELQRFAVPPPAAAQHLAIHGQPLKHRDFLLQQPGAADRLEVGRVQAGKHTKESAVTRRGGSPRSVGIARACGQDQEAAVVDNPTEAAGPLARTPTDPVLAALEMEGGGAEREQGDPLAVEFGDVAEGLAGQAGIGQIVLCFQGAVEGRAFVVADEAEGDSF